MNHSLLTIAIIVIAIALVFRIIDQRNIIEVLVSDLDYATDEIELLEDALYNMPIYIYRVEIEEYEGIFRNAGYLTSTSPIISNRDDLQLTQLSDEDAALYMRGLL